MTSHDEHGLRPSPVLTDRGAGSRGGESREYALYLAIGDIDHSPRPGARGPRICERSPRTVPSEFYRVAFRETIRRTIGEPTAMPGSPTTTSAGRIRTADASAKLRSRPSLAHSLLAEEKLIAA